MNKTYLLSGVAALLLGGYALYVLNATIDASGNMGGMAMDGSAPMNTGSASSAAAEGFQTAVNIMMEGIMRPATGYPDVDFVKIMISHHEGAVAMAKVEKQFGKDKILLSLADSIINTQEKELMFFKDWLRQQDQSAMQILPDANKANYAAMLTMMKGMTVSYTGNADADFANGMIPHHQGGIDMAKVVLQFGKDAEVRKLAETAISAQSAEVTTLKDRLAKAAP